MKTKNPNTPFANLNEFDATDDDVKSAQHLDLSQLVFLQLNRVLLSQNGVKNKQDVEAIEKFRKSVQALYDLLDVNKVFVHDDKKIKKLKDLDAELSKLNLMRSRECQKIYDKSREMRRLLGELNSQMLIQGEAIDHMD